MPARTKPTATPKRQPRKKTAARKAAPEAPPSKLDRLEAMLRTEAGASIAEMVEATGWQAHSVRGAMAGALKKRGLVIASEKVDGTRRYRAERSS